MSKARLLPALVLTVALAGLAATIGYAVVKSDDTWSPNRRGSSMMTATGHTAPWYAKGSGRAVRSIAAARERAQRFADRLGLVSTEVMRFEDNFYVRLDERNGRAATEVLVDPASGAVTLEYGPAMMWNTRYGMMGDANATGSMMDGGMGGGMMGGGMMGGDMMGGDMMGGAAGQASLAPSRGIAGPVTAARARTIANAWLRGQIPGVTAVEPDAFPGYFTLHTVRDGRVEGMLSVNRRTGSTWYHWWHGRFLAMAE